MIIGQNPGTNHPRMLTGLARPSSAARRCIAHQPDARAGLAAVQELRSGSAVCSASATALADQFLQVRINGDAALLKGLIEGASSRWTTVDAARPSTGSSSPSRPPVSRLWPPTCASFPGTPSSSKAALPRTDGGRRRVNREVRADHRLLGDGAHSAQRHAVATIQDIVNLILLRGSIGKPGAGRVPRARRIAMCKGTARWASGTAPPGVPRQARRGFQFRAAPRARVRHRASDQGHARGRP